MQRPYPTLPTLPYGRPYATSLLHALPTFPTLGRDTEVGNIFLNAARRSWGESGVI